MLDKTIDSALQNLRRDLIRNGGEGLDHVEALMRLRGVPMPEVRAKRRPDQAPQGMMGVLMLDALRDGPKTLRDLTAYVMQRRPELDWDAAYFRTAQALVKLRKKGLVEREGKVWGIKSA